MKQHTFRQSANEYYMPQRTRVAMGNFVAQHLLAYCMALSAWPATAAVQLPPLFSDNIVIQRQAEVPIWGKANPGEEIVVTVRTQKREARAGADGCWTVRLPSMEATEDSFTITIAGATNTVSLRNVLVGDVWLCSGQSNMQKPVGPWPGQRPVLNYEQEIAQANYPTIRLFNVEERQAFTPQSTCRGQWKVCSPETAGTFSAAAFFFARQLVRDNHVPIGLITAAVGGTFAQAWASLPALKNVSTYRGLADRGEELAVFAHTAKALGGEEAGHLAQTFKRQWWIEHDPGLLPGKEWTRPEFDDSSWKTMETPKNLWRYVGLPDFEGMVWYRRTFETPTAWKGKDLVFSFSGYSQEATFCFNGVDIGDRLIRESPDRFKIPAALIREEKNVIAVRVIGVNGGGGITGDPKDMWLAPATDLKAKIALAGQWPYRIGLSLKEIGAFPLDYNAALPGTLFNGMIHPVAPYSLKGILWYQGESDMTGGSHQHYRDVLRTLIEDWRSLFGRKNLPFFVVQLPNVTAPDPDQTRVGNYARVREAQLAVALSTPNVGLVTTIDIGEPDIHPVNKQEVGRRLAITAEGMVYGRHIEYSGPLYAGMRVDGKEIRLRFVHASNGLMTKGGGPLKGFAIAGKDGEYVMANAVISGDTVVVSAPRVAAPTVVRYAMADNPTCNLCNGAGLPASPFRTDCPETVAKESTCTRLNILRD